jgi:CheY-like chemotaxis protein
MHKTTPGSVRVLIVDDESDNAESLAALLRLGYECEAQTCTDGTACLEVVREFRPHLLLLDVHMPNMGGFKIARALREANLMPPLVVALSGSGGLLAIKESIEAGCDAHELKPMSAARMKELVAQANELKVSCS